MRRSGTAIREMLISERVLPQTGQVAATVVAKGDSYKAFSTAPYRFLSSLRARSAAICSSGRGFASAFAKVARQGRPFGTDNLKRCPDVCVPAVDNFSSNPALLIRALDSEAFHP